MYKITLKDGTVISNVELNGNNYITNETVNEDIFTADNLSCFTIERDDEVETYQNKMLSNFWVAADGTHIIFRDRTEADVMRERLEEYETAIVELAELIAEV